MKCEPEMLEQVDSTTTKTTFGCGNFYSTIDTLVGGIPCRSFLRLGKAGGCQRCLLQTVACLLTIILQDTNIPLERVCKTMSNMACDQGGVRDKSCIDSLSKGLKQYLPKED